MKIIFFPLSILAAMGSLLLFCQMQAPSPPLEGRYELQVRTDSSNLVFDLQLIRGHDGVVYGTIISRRDNYTYRAPIRLQKMDADTIYLQSWRTYLQVARKAPNQMQGIFRNQDGAAPAELRKVARPIDPQLLSTRSLTPLDLGAGAASWPSPIGEDRFYFARNGCIYLAEASPNGWQQQRLEYDSALYKFYSLGVSADGERIIAHGGVQEESMESYGSGDFFLLHLEDAYRVDEIQILPGTVNTGSYDIFPNFTPEGDLLLTSWGEIPGVKARGRADLYLATARGASYTVQPFGKNFNASEVEAGAYIDPERRFVLFHRNTQDPRMADKLFISRRTAEGWGPKEKISAPYNQPYSAQFAPRISPDGRWLYYNSYHRAKGGLYRVAASAIPELADFFD